MNPTAEAAATVSCLLCRAEFFGTIDAIRQAGWTWFSNDAERFFCCAACAAKDPRGLNELRQAARTAWCAANADPRRAEKMAARSAPKGVTGA